MPAMPRTPSLALLSALCGTLLAGCDSAPTEPAAPAAARPVLEQAPNVGEITFPVVFGIFDEETQLLAVFGLPDDPSQWQGCGGPVPGELLTIKLAGLKSGVPKALAKNPDVGIQVFRASGEREGQFGLESVAPFVCETSAIAAGTGRVRYTDNDLFGTGGGNNVINISLTGTLTDLQTGGLLRLTATHKFMQDLSTGVFTLKRLDGRVNLHPVGGR
jgi:hypothetical protein